VDLAGRHGKESGPFAVLVAVLSFFYRTIGMIIVNGIIQSATTAGMNFLSHMCNAPLRRDV